MLELGLAILFLYATWKITGWIVRVLAYICPSDSILSFLAVVVYFSLFILFASSGGAIGPLMVLVGVIYVIFKRPKASLAAIGVGALAGTRPWKK